MTWTMAIETGGTFTDLFIVSPEGQVFADKIPSTPQAPEQAAALALQRGGDLAAIEADAISRLLHGSTVAVNALIERRSAPPALITTSGFRDMLFIGRQEKLHIYDMAYQKPEPFTERALVYEVNERVGPNGDVVDALNPEEVVGLADRIVAECDVTTIAVCLLHSYANPAHEQMVAEILSQRQPQLKVILSSDVCPVHREFERASTTVINAYLHPIVDKYLGRFAQTVQQSGCAAEPLIMQANGGVLPVPATRQRPAGLYLSGPSAAVTGAARLARQAGLPSLITLDVGGTSTDICLVTDGEAHETGHGGAFGSIQGQPLNMVMTDIVTIGAGGGSIAWIDDGGMLRVGPQSAGAEPGPAGYDRQGNNFTLTDAMLCLGLLQDGAVLPGGIKLNRQCAARSAELLMQSLKLNLQELAGSVYRIAMANMAEAIRSLTVRRGYDPRDYTIFACGGAGPLVAAPLAEELEIASVLVPPDPGVFSAFGLTASGLRMDFAVAVEADGSVLRQPGALWQNQENLIARAQTDFAAAGVGDEGLEHSFTADVRYIGQGFELRVPFGSAADKASDVSDIDSRFHEIHAQRFGHAFVEQPVEITALRLTSTSPARAALGRWRIKACDITNGPREIWMDSGTLTAEVQDRAGRSAEVVDNGPLLIMEPTSSTWVPPDWQVASDDFGLLHLQRESDQ